MFLLPVIFGIYIYIYIGWFLFKAFNLRDMYFFSTLKSRNTRVRTVDMVAVHPVRSNNLYQVFPVCTFARQQSTVLAIHLCNSLNRLYWSVVFHGWQKPRIVRLCFHGWIRLPLYIRLYAHLGSSACVFIHCKVDVWCGERL